MSAIHRIYGPIVALLRCECGEDVTASVRVDFNDGVDLAELELLLLQSVEWDDEGRCPTCSIAHALEVAGDQAMRVAKERREG